MEAGTRSLPHWMTPNFSYFPLHPRIKQRERIPRMRLRLFRANPHCFWCGRKTRLDVAHGSSDFATVDHLYSRFHPRRVDRHREQKGALHVLACHECNNERGYCEQHQIPFVPKLSARLEYAQLADATLARKSAVTVAVQPPNPDPVIEIDLSAYDDLIRNAPDWPTTKLLMQARSKVAKRIRKQPMRVICTLREAVQFAKENPAR